MMYKLLQKQIIHTKNVLSVRRVLRNDSLPPGIRDLDQKKFGTKFRHPSVIEGGSELSQGAAKVSSILVLYAGTSTLLKATLCEIARRQKSDQQISASIFR